MAAQIGVLLINGSNDHQWDRLIAQIVATRGHLRVSSEQTIDVCLAQGSYAVVIIDASVVTCVPQVIRHIHAQQARARVIVVTAAPTWIHARAAFLAGAFDYIVKSLNHDDLETVIGAAIDAPPPRCR